MKSGNITIIYSYLERDKEDYYKDVDSVNNALEKLGYEVSKVAVGNNIIELLSAIKKISPMCIFNLCEEVNANSWGEVYIAGLLELLGIPYTGSGPTGLMLSLDKAKTKDVLRSHGIKVPLYQVLNAKDDDISETLKYPFMVKPLHEDGSYGIDRNSVVYDEKALFNKINIIYKEFKEPSIIEEFIKGRELNVSVLGNNKNLQVLPISEIDYSNMPKGGPNICSYNAKWRTKSREYKNTMPICPADLSSILKNKIQDISVKVYEIMECRDYARIDIRLDKNKIPYIIDVNLNPCLNPNSGFVRSAKTKGLSYEDLIKEILNACIERNISRYNKSGSCTQGLGKDMQIADRR